MNLTITTEDLVPEVEKAARDGVRSWGAVHDADDLAQGIWSELLGSPASLTKILESEKPDRYRVLRFIAGRVAQKENNAYEQFSGNHYYSTDDVRRILNRGGAEDEQPGTVAHSEWIDAQIGLHSLAAAGDSGAWYAEVLFSRYVVKDYDASTGDARKELTRARDALCSHMNRRRKESEAEHDGPGSRKLVSITAAQALIRRESGER